MSDLDQARETVRELDRMIAKLEFDTRERIARMTGPDGDADLVSRQEWTKFNREVQPIREQREHLAKAITTIFSMAPLPPMIVPAKTV